MGFDKVKMQDNQAGDVGENSVLHHPPPSASHGQEWAVGMCSLRLISPKFRQDRFPGRVRTAQETVRRLKAGWRWVCLCLHVRHCEQLYVMVDERSEEKADGLETDRTRNAADMYEIKQDERSRSKGNHAGRRPSDMRPLDMLGGRLWNGQIAGY